MTHPTLYRTVQIDGLSIFYREAGPKDAPVLLLLHGLPSSSRMFEPLFSRLSDRYHLIAPDYPGFGHSIVIHNYRWRLGLAEGEPKYGDLEKRLAASPFITVPTITLEGDANGAPHSEPSSYAKKFLGKYSHRTLSGGIGHNLPQEAPQAFAEAVLAVAGS